MISHLVESTVFAVAVALLVLAFRRNAARVRYGLWFAASVKFLLPFALLVSAGSKVQWKPAAASAMTAEVSFAMERIAVPLSAPALPRRSPVGGSALAGVWACGFAAVVLIRLRAWRRIRAAVRASVPLDIAAPVEIRSSSSLIEPGIVGCFRPILLLPEGIVDRLTAEQFTAVLEHEFAHVRRRDNLLSAIHMTVEAVFWFHPLVWWIGGRLVEERERACDEAVLRSGSEPGAYAAAIVSVCRWYADTRLACVAGVTGSDLKKRIEAIMTNRTGVRLNRAKRLLLVTAGLAALAGPVAVGVAIGIGAPPVLALPLPPVPQDLPAARTPAVPGRLLVFLFDLGSMTPEEQARARQSTAKFVQTNLAPGERVAVMLAGNGSVQVVRDFTADRVALEEAIANLAVESGEAPAVDARLASVAAAARILGAVEGKKALIYLTNGMGFDPRDLQKTVDALVQTKVAIFPIDVRGFPGAQGMAAMATYAGARSIDSTVAEALAREVRGQAAPTPVLAGFPGGDAAMETYPAGGSQQLSVPLGSLAGPVDIVVQIGPNSVAALRDSVKVPAGLYRRAFPLPAGSYTCAIVIRDRATGQLYGETIAFEVK
jgi:beta-lactamase regulating signal transducer with metallopeptidase domain